MTKLGPSMAELIKQLHVLQEENRSLKASHEEDLIKRHQAEEALRKSEQYYRLLVNSIPDTAIHLLDKDLRYLAIGGAEVEKNNFDKTKIEGRLLHEAFPKHIADIFEPLYKKALKGEATFFEMPYGEFLYAYQILPVKDPDGHIFATMSTAQNVTNRRKGEADLKESEEKYRSLVENSIVGVLKTGVNGEIFYVNDAILKMLEFDSREELMQQTALMRYKYPEQRREMVGILKRDGLVNGYEATILTKNGNERVFLYSLILMGEVISGTLIDITERKSAQLALQQGKRELSILMNNLPGMVYSCMNDPEWTMRFVSDGSIDLTGYLPEEFTEGKRISYIDIIHPDDRNLVWHTIQNCLELHTPFNLEYRIITKTGIVKSVWERGEGVVDTDGKIDRLEGFITDISARKQAEDSLREYRLLLKSSLESQKDTILLSIDKDYRYLYFNKAHQDVMKYAYQKDIELGMNILDCITSSEDRRVAKENYDRALNGETHSNIRIYGDVNQAYYESFFNPILNDDNEIIGATVLARNINDRINAEQEIKSQNEELQNLNATKDKFFSIIAHDLRSPFNAFLGLTQVMVEELPSLTIAELQKMAAVMRNSATNLYQLLENLLQWAQIQKGALPFKPEVIHLNLVINECIDMILESAKTKGVRIDLHEMKETAVFADNNMLQSVIRNLASNAVKYTPSGGTVKLSNKTLPEGFVEISVQDNGIGMSKTMVEQLFKIDSQINRKGTDGEPSTGLGLVLCSEFVEKHGGKIWAESEEGKGSTFHFTIPTGK